MVRSLPPIPASTAPELRAFYVACGLSPEVIERAIKARSASIETRQSVAPKIAAKKIPGRWS